LDVVTDRCLYIWVVEEEVFEFELVIGLQRWLVVVVVGPVVGLCNNESAVYLPTGVLVCEIFVVFNVLHVRDDRFGVETVLLIGAELLLRELLTLHTSWLVLAELFDIP
jgi:hypothetical protein